MSDRNIYTKKIALLGLLTLSFFTIVFASTTIETNLDSAIQYIQKIIFTSNGGDNGTTGVIIDGTVGSIGLGNGATVNNIKTDMTSTDNTSLATTETISGFVNSAINGFSSDNFYTTGINFNTSDGVLTILLTGAPNTSIDIDGRYLTTYTETDPVFESHVASGITQTNIDQRSIAYSRGNHATQGYLTSYTETDPVFMTHSGDYYTTGESDAKYITDYTELWTGTSNVIYYTGNVGIGIVSPSNALDISGSVAITNHNTLYLSNIEGNGDNYNSLWIEGGVGGKSTNGGNIYIQPGYGGSYGDVIIANTGGNVGVGTTSPSYKLDVYGSGHFSGNIYADEYYYNSDIRYKENIKQISYALDKIISINGYNFDWKKNGQHGIGIIAQEIENIFPELVTTKPDGYKAVQYGNLVAPIIEAIKEFYQEFTMENIKHTQELELLNQEIELLKTEISLIKNSK